MLWWWTTTSVCYVLFNVSASIIFHFLLSRFLCFSHQHQLLPPLCAPRPQGWDCSGGSLGTVPYTRHNAGFSLSFFFSLGIPAQPPPHYFSVAPLPRCGVHSSCLSCFFHHSFHVLLSALLHSPLQNLLLCTPPASLCHPRLHPLPPLSLRNVDQHGFSCWSGKEGQDSHW